MTTIIKQTPNTEEGDGEIVDERQVKRTAWTTLVRLATKALDTSTRLVAVHNTNYNNNTSPLPDSAAGTVRMATPIPTPKANTLPTKVEESFTAKIKARRSGGGSKGTGRGAK